MKFSKIKITPDLQDLIVKKGESSKVQVIITIAKNHSIKDLFERVCGLPGINRNVVEKTDHYVFAALTPVQIRKLEKFDEVNKIWINEEMGHVMFEPFPIANNSFNPEGNRPKCKDITWAVIDDGIDSEHEALSGSNVIDRDLTGEGPKGAHGTHVAGIIAGWCPEKQFSGIAPQCQLYNYKVIGKKKKNRGAGLVIKAMEEIRKLNKKSGKMVIHGANLSLATTKMPYNKEFQPGQSPVCEEANRLVESGVVVCVAAGNFGAQAFEVPGKKESEIWAGFVLMSISDPGTAALPITVGSTHKRDPYKYGISPFSSKGPTGDGRLKPDLVAPGERILSCVPGNNYVEESGTSQATPYVSGVAAQLLHAHPELIGRSKEVKYILIRSSNDLNRQHFFQGAGLVSLAGALEEAALRRAL